MADDKIICKCNHVTKQEIKQAVKDGASSVDEVRKALGMKKGCGGCNKDIKHYIKKQLEKTDEKKLIKKKKKIKAEELNAIIRSKKKKKDEAVGSSIKRYEKPVKEEDQEKKDKKAKKDKKNKKDKKDKK